MHVLMLKQNVYLKIYQQNMSQNGFDPVTVDTCLFLIYNRQASGVYLCLRCLPVSQVFICVSGVYLCYPWIFHDLSTLSVILICIIFETAVKSRGYKPPMKLWRSKESHNIILSRMRRMQI